MEAFDGRIICGSPLTGHTADNILRKEKINIDNNLMEEYLSNFDSDSQNKMKKIIYKLKLFDMEKSEA